ncbi:hypothetical protein [Cardinium endosymbiont of Philonthus spinipes]|uniref:hypothetical protein n=1 Tax=Cardinium endosymbiont of Philonthus spinipes TaxID=3077941 RepID=UPI00313CCE32
MIQEGSQLAGRGWFIYYGYLFLQKQVANPLPAAASPLIKKWRSGKTLTPERYVF